MDIKWFEPDVMSVGALNLFHFSLYKATPLPERLFTLARNIEHFGSGSNLMDHMGLFDYASWVLFLEEQCLCIKSYGVRVATEM